MALPPSWESVEKGGFCSKLSGCSMRPHKRDTMQTGRNLLPQEHSRPPHDLIAAWAEFFLNEEMWQGNLPLPDILLRPAPFGAYVGSVRPANPCCCSEQSLKESFCTTRDTSRTPHRLPTGAGPRESSWRGKTTSGRFSSLKKAPPFWQSNSKRSTPPPGQSPEAGCKRYILGPG